MGVAVGTALVVLAGAAVRTFFPGTWRSLMGRLDSDGKDAASDRAREGFVRAEASLPALFAGRGCKFPPARLALVAIKDEKRLELWAPGRGRADGGDGDGGGAEEGWRLVKTYPILAASGHAGPKLREGDRQVPEGLYRVVFLNPRSQFHLSMKIDYPNDFDREMGRRDGRTNLGGDIFIHGENASIGCLAIGNPPIEELYRLVEKTGKERVQVLIAPWDFRKPGARTAPPPGAPEWTGELYGRLRRELAAFRE